MKVQILTDYLYILPTIMPFFLWFIFLFVCLSFSPYLSFEGGVLLIVCNQRLITLRYTSG